jgi:drug/metabolite transporter (DMT)-like permease
MSAPGQVRSDAAGATISPVLHAIGWMVLCGLLFGVLNTTQKFLTHHMHPPQVLCLRYLVGSAVLLPFVIKAGWEAYRPHRPALMLGRGFIHVIGSTVWFLVLPHVTLAEQSAIGFTGPIFMMIGAWLFLGERMYAARWLAVLIAFAGVLIVVWPGLMHADAGSLYSLWLLAVAPIFAASFLISKTLTRTERPDAIVFWLGVMVGILVLPAAIYSIQWLPEAGPSIQVAWRWPTFYEWCLLLGCGLVGSGGHYTMTRAYQIADVSAVQPVRFLDLVWASVFGLIVFQDLPTIWALAGGSIICGATLWITRRESRRPAV